MNASAVQVNLRSRGWGFEYGGQPAQEGFLVCLEQDYLNQQEYRYVCCIGCGRAPVRVYRKAVSEVNWTGMP